MVKRLLKALIFVNKVSHVSLLAHRVKVLLCPLKAFEFQICTFFECMIQDRRAQILLKSYVTFYTWLLNSVWEGKKQLIFQNTHILEQNFPNKR